MKMDDVIKFLDSSEEKISDALGISDEEFARKMIEFNAELAVNLLTSKTHTEFSEKLLNWLNEPDPTNRTLKGVAVSQFIEILLKAVMERKCELVLKWILLNAHIASRLGLVR